jgi:DNA-directed RNA polymerase specialized sigma24 family protein
LNAIDNLSECAKRRVYAYYFFGKTHREIAVEEGVNRNAVEKSINCALKKLKKYF